MWNTVYSDFDNWALILTIIAAIVVITVITVRQIRYESEQRRKKIEEAFVGRKPLDPEKFYITYFMKKGVSLEVVEGVRKILEEQLYADMSRLTAEDDFSKNLSFFWDYDSMADVEIVCAIEEHFGITISDSEAEKAHTVRDIVNLVSAKVEKENAV